MSQEQALSKAQIDAVARQTLAILKALIGETDLPKLREEQEAAVIGQLGPVIFGELAAGVKAQGGGSDGDG